MTTISQTRPSKTPRAPNQSAKIARITTVTSTTFGVSWLSGLVLIMYSSVKKNATKQKAQTVKISTSLKPYSSWRSRISIVFGMPFLSCQRCKAREMPPKM